MAALTALQRLMKNPKTAKFVESLKHSDLPANWADDPEIVGMAKAAYKEMGTDSPFWQATFGNSKVVDDAGNPLRMYHGTGRKFNTFQYGKMAHGDQLGSGFYFTPKKNIAENYMPEGKGYLLETYIKSEKPFAITPENVGNILDNQFDLANAVRKTEGLEPLPERMRDVYKRRKDEYDAAISQGGSRAGMAMYNAFRDIKGLLEATGYDSFMDGPASQKAWQTVVTEPTQIKSVYNRGTFNPADQNMNKGLLPLIAAGGAAAALAPDSAQAAIPAERYTFPADRPGYVNPEPPLGTPLVDPVDILTAPVGVTTAAGKAAAMAAEPAIAYGVDRAIDGLLGLFQRDKGRGGGGGGI